MPTYRYECARCDAVHEIFHSMTDDTVHKCPDCGRKMERHVGGAGGVILKGSGFHNTDYRSSSYQSGARKDSDSSKPKKDDKKKSDSSSSKKKKGDAKS